MSDAAARAHAMQERVVRTARSLGASPGSVESALRAHALAMEPRLGAGLDDHDPDLLHPGRSALILLLDAGEVRGDVLSAAILTESRRARLRVAPGRVRSDFGAAVADISGEVPLPADDDLAERLLLAARETQFVALAEQLDHLRHAHLWPDLDQRREAHALAAQVYAPIAERVHPTLARRYRWWCAMFERNHLR